MICIELKGLNDKECSIYTDYVVKDYGSFEKQIVFKNNVRISYFEEEDKDGRYDMSIFNDNLSGLDRFLKRLGLLYADDHTRQNNIARSKRRSKSKVFNMAILNDWDYFVTLTFDKEKVGDRYDLEKLRKKTLEYFKNQSKKHGIKYLLVPELHEDGALHWHGLIRDCNNKMNLVSADIKSKSDRNVYNIVSWSDNKGYNTAVKIDIDLESRSKVSSYISKYITKMEEKLFKSYYYCSQGLVNEPEVKYDKEIPIDFFLDEDKIFENEFCYIKTVNKENEEKEKC